MNDCSSFYCEKQDNYRRDESFGRHILGRLFMHAVFDANKKGRSIAASLGFNEMELFSLLDYLHLGSFWSNNGSGFVDTIPEDEELMLRELLEHNCLKSFPAVQWLPALIARRSMEPNHLWEDLGLAQRPDLTKLLMEFFPSLASKNTRNMRWKRFLYRSLCEAEGFTMCPSPTCDSCSEFNVCYSDDSGEAVMARNQRAANLVDADLEKGIVS